MCRLFCCGLEATTLSGRGGGYSLVRTWCAVCNVDVCVIGLEVRPYGEYNLAPGICLSSYS